MKTRRLNQILDIVKVNIVFRIIILTLQITKSYIKINLLETIRKRITGSTELKKVHNIHKDVVADIGNNTVEFLKDQILAHHDDTLEDVISYFI